MNSVTITGRLGQDVELRFTQSGKAVANFSIADTPRRLNRDTQQWEDAGETLWLRGSLWGAKAEALAEVGRKGDLVTAIGRLEARSWEDKNSGEKRTVTEMSAQEVGVVPKSTAATSQPQSHGWGGQPQQSDPWATQAPAPQQGQWATPNAPTYDEPPF